MKASIVRPSEDTKFWLDFIESFHHYGVPFSSLQGVSPHELLKTSLMNARRNAIKRDLGKFQSGLPDALKQVSR